jgi:lysophospholipase L1-like esterase
MEFYTPKQDLERHTPEVNTDNDKLPSVLLLGDSISQGYTPFVRDLLKGICKVERPRANCGDTRAGLQNLDTWLDGRHWNLIHFNWGLHDLCHRHPDSTLYGNRDKIKGPVSVTPDEYRKNLSILVTRLKQAADRLIWANTTKVPPDEAGRFEGDDARYNAIADAIMQTHGVATNDLYSLTSNFGPELFTAPGDVHFTEAGTKSIADQVARCIKKTLAALIH